MIGTTDSFVNCVHNSENNHGFSIKVCLIIDLIEQKKFYIYKNVLSDEDFQDIVWIYL